jgi:hypothetical protein
MAVTDEARFCPGCGTEINPVQEDETNVEPSPSGNDDTTRQSMFYVGAVLGVLGVLFLPFFFFLVALPEAIIHLVNGGSILDSLSKDASENPAMKGTFLIFRWFGNFLILMFVLGMLLGILLVFA